MGPDQPHEDSTLAETDVDASAALSSPTDVSAATSSKNKAVFTLQVGAFHNKAYADAKLEQLKILGSPAYLIEVMDRKQAALYLVCFGRFQTFAEAADTMAAFKEKEKMPAVAYRTGSRQSFCRLIFLGM